MCGSYGDFNFWQDRQLSRAFNKFAGAEVNPADPEDKVLKEMRQEAAMFYSHLRLVPQGTASPGEQITRINAELVAGADGKFHIGNRFFRG